MGDIIIEEANYKAFIMMASALLLFIATGAIMIYGIVKDRKVFAVSGALLAIIFFVGFIIELVKVSNPKKLLTITRDGIIDNSSLGAVGFIPYGVIKEFKIITLFDKEAIAVIPKNVDSFLAHFSAGKRRIIKRNIHLNYPAVAIYVDMAKDMEPEDILTLLQKRLTDYTSIYE